MMNRRPGRRLTKFDNDLSHARWYRKVNEIRNRFIARQAEEARALINSVRKRRNK